MSYTFSGSNRSPVGATTGYSTANPVTGSVVIGSRDTLLVLMFINSGGAARTGGAPTFAGSTMSQADTSRRGATSPEISSEMWYITASGINLPTLPTSASEVSLPNGGGDRICWDVVTAYPKPGKTSAVQVTTGSVNTGATANPYCPITTTAGSTIIFEVVANGANSWAPTGRTATFTNINDNDIGNYGGGMMYRITDTIGVITGSWIFGTTEDWGVVMAAFGETDAPIYLRNAAQTQTVSSPTLTAHAPQFSAVAQNCTQTQTTSSAGVLSAHYSLTLPIDWKQTQTVDNVILTQHYVLGVYSPTQVQITSAVSLSAHYNIATVYTATQTQITSQPVIVYHQFTAQLTIDAIAHGQIALPVTLNAHYTITSVYGTVQAQIVNQPTLVYHQFTAQLTVESITQIQAVSSIILLQHYSGLAIGYVSQLQTTTSVTLSAAYSIITDSDTMMQVVAIITFATGGLTRQMMHYARMRRK